MTKDLLNEANVMIIRIDMGLIPYEQVEGNYAKFRLMHLERSLSREVMS